MTISANTLSKLIAAGIDGQQLVEIVASIEADMQPKKSKGAERQARYRARKAEQSVTSDVTHNVTSDAIPPLSPIPLSSPPTPPPIIPQTPISPRNKTGAGENRSSGAGSRLQADWSPTPEQIQFALNEGHTTASAYREADKFRDFWISKTGKDATKKDWPATWRNWIRNSKPPEKTKAREGPKLTAFQQQHRENIEYLERFIGKSNVAGTDNFGESIDLGPEDYGPARAAHTGF